MNTSNLDFILYFTIADIQNEKTDALTGQSVRQGTMNPTHKTAGRPRQDRSETWSQNSETLQEYIAGLKTM